jgi:hypothetical protein
MERHGGLIWNMRRLTWSHCFFCTMVRFYTWMFECQTFEDSLFGSFLANACGLASLQATPFFEVPFLRCWNFHENMCCTITFAGFRCSLFAGPGQSHNGVFLCIRSAQAQHGATHWKFASFFSLTKHWTPGDSTRLDGRGDTKRFPAGARCGWCRPKCPQCSPHCLGQSSQTDRRGPVSLIRTYLQNEPLQTRETPPPRHKKSLQAVYEWDIFSPDVDNNSCWLCCRNGPCMHSFQSFSNQAAIDPTAYRENRIKQLKEAGGLGSSIRVLRNLRFERMKPFD